MQFYGHERTDMYGTNKKIRIYKVDVFGISYTFFSNGIGSIGGKERIYLIVWIFKIE
jgi:hypothetical protein